MSDDGAGIEADHEGMRKHFIIILVLFVQEFGGNWRDV